ncbi:CD63 antigen-like [Moschus berezovskii]|uniref:CD63 antigen-like n=1 Tax=Moschus berezovskii TaxID=68408 RepID=UPI002444C87B|nr:CD63 antigen-like [Moschus berezovskii]
MVLEGGMKCVKILLYVLLLTCCICAVGLIAVGIGAKLDLNQTVKQGAAPESMLPVVIIAVGVFLFLVAFVGCYGVCKENYCLMIMLAICLSLIMLVEVVAVVAGYMLKDKVMSESNKEFQWQIQNYPKSNHISPILDRMQEHFKCCIAVNYTVWEKILLMTKRVPGSYCISITKGCGINFNIKEMHAEDCVDKTGAWLRIKEAISTGLSVAFMEVLGIIFACCLVKSIRSGYDDTRDLISSACLTRRVG